VSGVLLCFEYLCLSELPQDGEGTVLGEHPVPFFQGMDKKCP
jgi:hypothetical protein